MTTPSPVSLFASSTNLLDSAEASLAVQLSNVSLNAFKVVIAVLITDVVVIVVLLTVVIIAMLLFRNLNH